MVRIILDYVLPDSAMRAPTDLDFTKSHWGEAYPKLLAVKDKYDPHGLFICHHCVGSERWTKESHLNCRAK